MKNRLWLILSIAILFFLFLNVFIGWSILVMLNYFDLIVLPLIFWILFAIVALSFVIGRIPLLRGPIGRLLKVIGAYYLFVFEFSVIVLPFAHLTAWCLGRLTYDAHVYVPIISYVVLGLLVILLARGSWNAWSPIVRTYELTIDKEVAGLKQLRIGMASDFHLGNVVGKRHLRKFVEKMEDLQPDLILLAGDVIDDSIEPFIRNRMDQVLGQLHARFGVFAVLGNHEYIGRHHEQYVREMKKINIPVLQDEVVLVDDLFYIVGRKDKSANYFDKTEGRLDTKELLLEIDLARPIIMMDHQPTEYDIAEAEGVDLLLSGHTHRGQFFPNHFLTRKLFELDWGYLLKSKMHAIVSSGFGTWGPPIRLGSRSEIIEIVVRFR